MISRIDDDPYSDYSDYIERKGVYRPVAKHDTSDAAYEQARDEELNITWDPINEPSRSDK